VVEHVGTARTEAELGVLMREARARLAVPGQGELDLGIAVPERKVELVGAAGESALFALAARPERALVAPGRVVATGSRVLYDALGAVYDGLGYGALGDAVFRDLVIAWVVKQKPLRKAGGVIRSLGAGPVSESTVRRAMRRCAEDGYRDRIAGLNFQHVLASGDVSLCLYDVTTLATQAEKEDGLRKVGYSKERSIDPQVVIGLLVDRRGFPLEIGCFEGNKAEKLTLLPIIERFRSRHGLEGMAVVADAGMLSASNLAALDGAGIRFIVGARNAKGPYDLASRFRWAGNAFEDGEVVDTVTAKIGTVSVDNDPARRPEPVWDPDAMPGSWRAVWAYSRKRFVRDSRNITKMEEKAREIVTGGRPARNARFVTTSKASRRVNEAAIAKARDMAGLKGYLTNIPAGSMAAAEVIAAYHDLWEVERSFRMFKSDLSARPMRVFRRQSIEAHVTRAFAALAVSREIQRRTGLAIANVIDQLEGLRFATIAVNGAEQTFPPEIPCAQRRVLDAITSPTVMH
jgi:hypothetical protein